MALKSYDAPSPSSQITSGFPTSPSSSPILLAKGKRYTAPSTESMGWKEAATTVRRRAIAMLSGERKSGKLHTALTAPPPIYLHSFDFGTEGVVENFRNGKYGRKAVYVAEYPSPDQVARSSSGGKDDVMQEAIRVWQIFEQQYYDSLAQTRKEGTVIVDTGGQCFDLLVLAEFGRTERIMPRSRGKVNARMAALMRAAYGSSNSFWLHTLKDEYKDLVVNGSPVLDDRGEVKSAKTGEKLPRGFSEAPFIVQMVGRCERVDLATGGSQFQVRIQDSRHNPWANGLVIENNYETIAWALHEYAPEKVEAEGETTEEAAE